MDEKFKVLYGLHRIVIGTTSVKSRLAKAYTDGKPEVILTINELGIKGHEFTYRIYGSSAQEEYRKAIEHLTQILKMRETA